MTFDARIRTTAAAGLLASAFGACLPAAAQTFPNGPVRFIVPFAAGGTSDILARQIAPKLSEALGQPVLVENRAGANGNVGAEVVARATPDGHTLLLADLGAIAINPSVYKQSYDPVRDLAGVTMVAYSPHLLVVHPSVPVKTVKDLVAFAKQRPGELGWATAGIGSTGHMAGAYFAGLMGISLNHVPYKSNPAAGADVIGGHVPIMFDQLSTASPHIRAGKFRALAITSPKRHPLLPEVPTMGEVGFPAFTTSIWLGLLGPAKMPRDIVDRINGEVNRYLATPAAKERFTQLGLDIFGGSPEALATRMKSDLAAAQKTVQIAGIKPQ
jgi:tripartite-type tricarboxylate transporter receptor subunit TctC